MLADRLSFLFLYIQLELLVGTIGPKYKDVFFPKAHVSLIGLLPTISQDVLFNCYTSSSIVVPFVVVALIAASLLS